MNTKSATNPPGPLGWIAPEDRTSAQQAAHAHAVSRMVRFALTPSDLAAPISKPFMLTDFWKKPEVVQDVGFEFNGFHQLTGSCVGVSDGNAVFTVAAVQRMIADSPTKAFVPFWPFMYGRTRFLEGDRGRGEGAVDSVMGTQNATEGIIASTEQGLPQFSRSDGLMLTEQQELQWSDGASSTVTNYLPVAKPHLMGSRAQLNSSQDIKAAILNGYPVLDGCENYVGHGSIKGSGENAYVTGRYDGRGGHSTCLLGYWDHPNDGPLYLYSNQWPTSTYPTDPAGGGRCTVWLPESEVDKLFRTGGSDGETMALSHLNWFPAQVDKLIHWII